MHLRHLLLTLFLLFPVSPAEALGLQAPDLALEGPPTGRGPDAGPGSPRSEAYTSSSGAPGPAYRSPTMAFVLPLGVTAGLVLGGSAMTIRGATSGGRSWRSDVGMLLVGAGLLMGPSAGHLWLGRWDTAMLFGAGRLLSAATVLWLGSTDVGGGGARVLTLGALAQVSLAGFWGLVIGEIVTSAASAEAVNRQAAGGWAVTPWYAPDDDAAGLRVALSWP